MIDPLDLDAPAEAEFHPHVSAVIPLFNEEETLPLLVEKLVAALSPLEGGFEIILVDDGSRDATALELLKAEKAHPQVHGVYLSRNYGQSTAMQAGFERARGEIVVALDGDLQNDPADIPKLIDRLEETGADVVSGWRKDRQDPPVRKLFSRVANRAIARLTGVRLHDFGCSLKAYRREVLQRARVLGEMHRFLAAIIAEVGGRVEEVPVSHHPRQFGRSKYGLDRTFRVLLDMLLVYFLRRYVQRPLHFFGYLGMLLAVPGGLIIGLLVLYKTITGADILGPMLLLSVMLMITGVMLIGQGLMSELLTRQMFEAGSRQHYFTAPAHRMAAMERQLAAREAQAPAPPSAAPGDG